METSDARGHQPSGWLKKDPTIHHPELSSNLTGLSLQDIRTYYLRDERLQDIEDCAIDTAITTAPWYIAEPQSDLVSSLCDICKHVNFQWLLRNDTSTNDGPILLLQDMLASRSTCNFCRLATTALCTAEGEIRRFEELLVEDEVVCCCITSNFSTGMENGPAMLSIWRRILGVTGGILAPVAQIHEIEDFENGCLGRRISSTADPQLIKAWLDTCENNHEDTPTQKSLLHPQLTGSKFQLRLLDVQDDCIVCRDHDTRYVALSYVWGRVTQLRLLMSNFDTLTTKGALSHDGLGSQLPRTISDAKRLAASLGERYLWVGKHRHKYRRDKDANTISCLRRTLPYPRRA
jgi:hypothetical protein